ncbi:hypothetical protein ALT785_320007 [Alteromonas infernus]
MSICKHIDSSGNIYEDDIENGQNYEKIFFDALESCKGASYKKISKKLEGNNNSDADVELINVTIGSFDYYFYLGRMSFRSRKNPNEIGLQISKPHTLKRMNEFLGLNIICVGVYSNITKKRKSEVLFYFFNLHHWCLTTDAAFKNIGKSKKESSSSLFAFHDRDSSEAIKNKKPNLRENGGRLILTCRESELCQSLREDLHKNFYIKRTADGNPYNFIIENDPSSTLLSKPIFTFSRYFWYWQVAFCAGASW